MKILVLDVFFFRKVVAPMPRGGPAFVNLVIYIERPYGPVCIERIPFLKVSRSTGWSSITLPQRCQAPLQDCKLAPRRWPKTLAVTLNDSPF